MMKFTLARSLFAVFASLSLLLVFLEPSWTATRTTSSSSTTAKKSSRATSRSRKRTTTQAKATHRRTTLKKSYARNRRSRRIPSVDPTIGDNTEGEDPVIRSEAVEALGHLDGSIVVVDPSNGRILTVVNQKLALSKGYQPCSTFKLAISLAGLSEGVFSKDSEFRCPYRGYLDFTDALAYSCNQYFQNVGARLGFDRVKKYAEEFGFGELAGLNISGEKPGIFPQEIDEQWIRLLSSHGQFIEVTPLEMAAFVSAVANGGTLYYLQYPRSAEDIADFQPKVKRHLEISTLLPDLREGMSGSVTYGSGRHAYNPLEPIYGKTGSCSGQGTHLGWFVSYAGDSDRKLVVVVLIRGSRYTEGPYAAMIAGRLYRGLSQQNYFLQSAEGVGSSTAIADHGPSANRNIQ